MTFSASDPAAPANPNASPRDVGIELPACGASAPAATPPTPVDPNAAEPDDSPGKTFAKRRLSVAASGAPQ